MSAISQKSISGITSITTPVGVDDIFTIHSGDTTERFRVDQTGNQNISGIVTASNFKTGSSNLHSTGLTVGDTFLHSTGVNGSSMDVDDFVSVGNNIHLGNAGVITATSFVGSGAALTGIDATAIKDSGGNVKIQAQASGAIHTGVSTFTGTLNSTGGIILTANMSVASDTSKVFFGASNDLSIYHNGSHSYIDDTGTGNLKLRSNNLRISNADESKLSATFQAAGAVELYHDGTKKFETASDGTLTYGAIKTNAATSTAGSASQATLDYNGGNTRLLSWNDSGASSFSLFTRPSGGSFTEWFRVEGDGGVKLPVDNQKLYLGTGHDFHLFFDGTNSNIRNTNDSGRLDIRSDTVHISDNDNTHDMARFNYQGSVELYHNYSKKFETTSAGITVTGTVDSASDVILKENIKTIDNALDKVTKLRGVEYDYKENKKHSIGVIAQEVEEVLPELVNGSEQKSVAYGNIAAVLIEAIKEQNEIINKMKKEIQELKG